MLENYMKEFEKNINISFTRDNILNSSFLLDREGDIEIYYAPHNEIINKRAKVCIVGITPGWTQTLISYNTVTECLRNGTKDLLEIKRLCKHNARFAGSMRNNIIEMLNELKLNEFLSIKDCKQLFEELELLHTTSLIPYPVFVKGRNYTGFNPSILESKLLSQYLNQYFVNEIKMLNDVLIIPLGKAVEKVLSELISLGTIKEEQCLLDFPHPSGANGHRKKQFDCNKEQMRDKIKVVFNSNNK